MKLAYIALAATCFALSCSPTGKYDSESAYWKTEIEDAERILRETGITSLDKGSAMLQVAQAYSALGKNDKVLSMWSEIIDDDGVHRISKARAQYHLGLFYDKGEAWGKAVDNYEKFSVRVDALSESERLHFDGNTENSDSLLCRAGQISERYLKDTKRATHLYQEGLRRAKAKNACNVDSLTELLGDFYFRQKQYDKAIAEYEVVSASFRNKEFEMASPVVRPEYKIIRSMMLVGRKEEAKKRYDQVMQRWGSTDYQLDKEYVEKLRVLMKK